MNKLQILYIGNDAMFQGIYLSMLTILERTKSSIDFYCMSGDLTKLDPKYISLTQKHIELLKKLVLKYNANNTFNVLDCSQKYISSFNNGEILNVQHWTPYTLFRLYIDQFTFNNDKLLYLDTDILIAGDIKQAFDVDMKDNELCVCHDRVHWKRNNKNWFNAGVLLINLNEVKKTQLLPKSLKYCIENEPKYMDQDALNLNWTRIMFFDDEYRFNFQPNIWPVKCKVKSEPIIYHFFGKWPYYKPWVVDKFLKQLKRKKLHMWDNDFKKFIEAKKEF